jgi:pyruvate/2-oxoglutarate dehydrogenase complex dihydrolipoamide dehydrogenase (E3) component
MREHFDCIVIGTGQAGGPLARELAEAGRKVAVVERGDVGGTCVNVGCTPTKTMVASARVAHLARRGADYGVQTGPIQIDMQKIRQRKRDIVVSFRGGSERRTVNTQGLTLIRGEASFAPSDNGRKAVNIALNPGEDTKFGEISADLVFINTGERPAKPNIPGLEDVPGALVLNSTSVMELGEVPDHLIVIGGGYIGLEFGQMFRRFGANVTIVQRGGRLLGREDADIADEVAKIMGEEGIDVLLNTEPLRAAHEGGKVRLTIKTSEGERVLVGSHVLVAAGRMPNTEPLNLAAVGVETDTRGSITVNERLETTAPSIYALGDVKGGPAFTHISYDDYRIVRDNVLHSKNATTANRFVPYTVFIDPELGRVGIGEDEARAKGRDVRVAKMPMSHVARALETDETRGLMKAVVDARTEQILGFAMLGIMGGEIMSVVQVAMMGKLPYTALQEATFAHPTVSEALNNLFATL